MSGALAPSHQEASAVEVAQAKSVLVAGAVVATIIMVVLGCAAWFGGTRLAATNTRVGASRLEVELPPGQRYCQGPELMPEDAAFARIFVRAPAPTILDLAYEHRGDRAAWTERIPAMTGPLTTRLPAAGRTLDAARWCFTNRGDGALYVAGNLTPANPDAPIGPNGFERRDEDEVRLDFLREQPAPYATLAAEAARNYANVAKPSFVGPWTLWLVLGTCLAVGALAVRLAYRVARDPDATGGWRSRTAAWCMGLTVLAATAWALLTPPFQVPDELVHSQYAQYLGTSGRFPIPDPDALDRDFRTDRQDEQETLFRAVPFSAEGKPIWSDTNDETLDERLDRPLAPASSAGARNAAHNPPLYYVYQAMVTRIVAPLRAEDRLLALRLASALLAGGTALLAFGFIREALPSSPLSATVGSLAIGLHPLVGFLGGGVNNDNLLILLGTAVFFMLARSFRRGLTLQRGVALGTIIAAGLLTKTRMALLIPVVAGALLLMLIATKGRQRSSAASGVAGAAAVAWTIPRVWDVLATEVFHRTVETSSVTSQANTSGKAIDQMLSYAWQYFLPRLWFMSDQFVTWPQYGLWQVYIEGFVGRFGWFQYSFPRAVNVGGFAVVLGLVALAIGELVRHRSRARRRAVELLTYVGLLVSSLFFLAIVGYRYRADTGYNLEQTRYLFPCVASYGGVVALAIRGAGRWRAPAAGALVALCGAHTFAAMLLTVTRYYL